MVKYILSVLILFLLFSCRITSQKPSAKLLEEIEGQLSYLVEKTTDEKKVPRSFSEAEGYKMVGITDWTCGFNAGTFWSLYELTGNEKWKKEAIINTEKLAGVQFRTNTHDLGFTTFCSFGNGYRITGNDAYKKVVLQASETLIKRFDKNIGCIRSWDFGDWQFPVIIDNLMNLEMLLWATEQTGDPKFREVAISHANTTMANHFRDDWSSVHVVSYDTTNYGVELKQTHQGLNDGSAWGRGQAWGLYGYTVMYRATGDEKYLALAENIAGFIIPNLPDDKVSYWDFNDPKIPNTYRDVSAAAVTASALFELATFDVPQKSAYLKVANEIIASLNSPKYRAEKGTNGGFLLMHSVGNFPKNSEVDVPINYADYYYLEALKRQSENYKKLN